MLLNITALMIGLALLVWSADRFVLGAAALARNLGLPPLLIGLTIVALGTSAPEILVSAMAALQGNPGLAIGNALGSNIANIGLILGVTATIAPLSVHSATLRREYPMLLAISLAALLLMADGELGRTDGVVLAAGLMLLLYGMVRLGLRSRAATDPMGLEFEAEIPEAMPTARAIGWFLVGLLCLLISSRILVWGSVNIAQAFGISDLIIGLTIVSVGTSLPELAATVASALKKEHDIALGNIIGSNMFNLLAVLSLPGIIAPGPFAPEILARDLPVMIGLTLAIFVMGFGFGGPGRINRLEGLILALAFIAYQALLFADAIQEAPATAWRPLDQVLFITAERDTA